MENTREYDPVRAFIARRSRRDYIKRACLALLLACSLIAVFVLACRFAQSDYAHTEQTKLRMPPIIYYGMMILIVGIVAHRFRLYDIFTRRSCRGTVKALRHTSAALSTRDAVRHKYPNLPETAFPRATYHARRVYHSLPAVSLDIGSRSFLFVGGINIAFAEQYYQVGDEIEYAYGATFPWNLTRAPERPFCPACGMLSSPNEQQCYGCGCPLISSRLQERSPE